MRWSSATTDTRKALQYSRRGHARHAVRSRRRSTDDIAVMSSRADVVVRHVPRRMRRRRPSSIADRDGLSRTIRAEQERVHHELGIGDASISCNDPRDQRLPDRGRDRQQGRSMVTQPRAANRDFRDKEKLSVDDRRDELLAKDAPAKGSGSGLPDPAAGSAAATRKEGELMQVPFANAFHSAGSAISRVTSPITSRLGTAAVRRCCATSGSRSSGSSCSCSRSRRRSRTTAIREERAIEALSETVRGHDRRRRARYHPWQRHVHRRSRSRSRPSKPEEQFTTMVVTIKKMRRSDLGLFAADHPEHHRSNLDLTIGTPKQLRPHQGQPHVARNGADGGYKIDAQWQRSFRASQLAARDSSC